MKESRLHALAGTLYRVAIEAHRLLIASGWARSRMTGMVAQDRNGQPVPWLSYPALHWLDGYVRPGMAVFEWGSGQSTRWFRARGCVVSSVDHDPAWAAIDALLMPDRDAYVSAFGGCADLVMIDGEWREDCARRVVEIGQVQVVVLDNAESFKEADAVLTRVFRWRIPFLGLAPGYTVTETVVFLGPHRRGCAPSGSLL